MIGPTITAGAVSRIVRLTEKWMRFGQDKRHLKIWARYRNPKQFNEIVYLVPGWAKQRQVVSLNQDEQSKWILRSDDLI